MNQVQSTHSVLCLPWCVQIEMAAFCAPAFLEEGVAQGGGSDTRLRALVYVLRVLKVNLYLLCRSGVPLKAVGLSRTSSGNSTLRDTLRGLVFSFLDSPASASVPLELQQAVYGEACHIVSIALHVMVPTIAERDSMLCDLVRLHVTGSSRCLINFSFI